MLFSDLHLLFNSHRQRGGGTTPTECIVLNLCGVYRLIPDKDYGLNVLIQG